jgi:hypothetical protein
MHIPAIQNASTAAPHRDTEELLATENIETTEVTAENSQALELTTKVRFVACVFPVSSVLSVADAIIGPV